MKKSIVLIVVMISVVSMNRSIAQHFNQAPTPIDEKMSIGLKINKPFFKELGEVSGLSGVYKLYGYFPLKRNWQINAEIPLVVAKWKDNDYNDNETGLANLFVEFQKALKEDKTTYLAFGLYIPTIGSEKYDRMIIGVLSDPYHFVQYNNGITINSTIGINMRTKPGVIFGLEIGPDLFIPTTEEIEGVELLIHYGAKGGYRFNAVSAWAEFSGILMATEEGSIDENWINQLFFGAQLNNGKFRPGIFYGIFLEKDYREGISGTLGLNLQMVLSK